MKFCHSGPWHSSCVPRNTNNTFTEISADCGQLVQDYLLNATPRIWNRSQVFYAFQRSFCFCLFAAAELWMGSRASWMLSKRCATEQHPQPRTFTFKNLIYLIWNFRMLLSKYRTLKYQDFLPLSSKPCFSPKQNWISF